MMSAEPFSDKHREYLRTHSREQIIAHAYPIARGWRYNSEGMCWILPGATAPDYLERENKQGRVICLSTHCNPLATAAHAAVDKSVAEAMPGALCEECGGRLALHHGKHSQKWFWKHMAMRNCPLDQTGNAIFFNTREEAEKATEVFE